MSNKLNIGNVNLETPLNIEESKQFLKNKLIMSPIRGDGQSIDAEHVLKMCERCGLTGDPDAQIGQVVGEAVNRMAGVEEEFDMFTVEALDRINIEYFTYLVDASYNQTWRASDIVAQGIGASEHLNGSTFTRAELLETGEYIVDDYGSFVDHVTSFELSEVAQKVLSESNSEDLADALSDLEPEQLQFDI